MKKRADNKRSVSSSTESPYFAAASARQQKRRRRKASVASSSNWTVLKPDEISSSLPTHLRVGNDYFVASDDDKKDRLLLLRLDAPQNYSLSQAICSYGYFCLAPNRWVPSSSTTTNSDDDDEGYLVRPLRYGPCHEHSTQVAIGQYEKGILISIAVNDDQSDGMKDAWLQQIVNQVIRMLRLDLDLKEFHSLHPEAAKRGFGRLYRSPTLFEDIIKTITNCNMKWSGTVDMNAKLCRELGCNGAFPTPLEIQQSTPQFLKENCRLGYRSQWIWDIANDIVEGSLDLDQLEQIETSDQLLRELQKLTGIGEFASNNLLHLMGFFDSHPYDTETVRLFKEDFNMPAAAAAAAAGTAAGSPTRTKKIVFQQAKAKYQQYEPYQFIAYWFDLWKNYEKRAGGIRSPQWSIEQNEMERPQHIVQDHNRIFVTSSPQRKKKKKKTGASSPTSK